MMFSCENPEIRYDNGSTWQRYVKIQNSKTISTKKVSKVYLNGVYKGITPLVIKDLPAGKYKLMVDANKYRPSKQEVLIEKDKK
ncbi:MAG: PEGA domain-containing protein, partial [Bacteroidia bacterium]|nr:PEGA domain-containing protein [Bacteroidia bacterium]